MIKNSLILALGAFFTCGLAAQSQVLVSLSTADVVGVHANRTTDLARSGQPITDTLELTATDARSARSTSAATLVPLNSRTGSNGGARFGWSALANSGSLAGTIGGNPPAAAGQRYEMRLVSRQPVTGQIMIHFGGRGESARAGASVRLGRDVKTFAANGMPQRDAFDGVTVDANGVVVAIEITGRAAADARTSATYSAHLNLAFVADPGTPRCTVTFGQASCSAGGNLRGAVDTSRRGPVLNLGLSGALTNAIGLTLVSPSPRTFPIGRTDCIFFADPLVYSSFTTDRSGGAQTAIPFPHRAGASFSVQQATLQVTPQGLVFATSNTLAVTCH